MPQILQHRPTTGRDTATPSPARWRVGQIVAPAILALALAGVAILMFAPGTGVGRLQSSVQQAAREPASLVGTLTPFLESTASLDAAGAEKRPALTLDDLLLVEKAEAMLERGDIIGARRELAEAAAAGNTHAKFALAETFDPNMLAARGLRVPVADAGTARALYTQALAAGDARAQRRLEGLQQAK